MPYPCPHCNNVYAFTSSRSLHIKNQHLRVIRSNYFECLEHGCDYKTLRKDHFIKHKITHSDDKSYQCSSCPKQYKRKTDLNRHIKNKHEQSNIIEQKEPEENQNIRIKKKTGPKPIGDVLTETNIKLIKGWGIKLDEGETTRAPSKPMYRKKINQYLTKQREYDYITKMNSRSSSKRRNLFSVSNFINKYNMPCRKRTDKTWTYDPNGQPKSELQVLNRIKNDRIIYDEHLSKEKQLRYAKTCILSNVVGTKKKKPNMRRGVQITRDKFAKACVLSENQKKIFADKEKNKNKKKKSKKKKKKSNKTKKKKQPTPDPTPDPTPEPTPDQYAEISGAESDDLGEQNESESECNDFQILDMDAMSDMSDILHNMSQSESIVIHGNDDECNICDVGGILLCCDYCPRSYHLICIGLETEPSQSMWQCPTCKSVSSKDKREMSESIENIESVDNTIHIQSQQNINESNELIQLNEPNPLEIVAMQQISSPDNINDQDEKRDILPENEITTLSEGLDIVLESFIDSWIEQKNDFDAEKVFTAYEESHGQMTIQMKQNILSKLRLGLEDKYHTNAVLLFDQSRSCLGYTYSHDEL